MSRSPSGPAELRRDLLWAFLLAAVFFGAALGARDLWHPNEPVYGRAVVEMADRGDWLLPTVNGVVFDEKPILYFWMARVSGVLLGGLDEFALRLPLALTGTVSVLLVYLLVLPYAGRPRARIGAAIFATTYIVFWASRAVQMDLLVLASCLATVLSLTRTFDHGFPERRAWVLAGISAGVGFAAKGPVALVCPGLVVLGYLLATRRLRLLRPSAMAWAGLAFLAVASPWYVALWATGESRFLEEVLIRQNFRRYLDPWDHQAGWWYYLVYFWIDMAPWALFLPLTAALPDRDEDERRLDRLAWIWILALVAFFSMSASKRSAYLMPAAPALAILVSGLAERWFDEGLDRLRRVGVVTLLGGIAVALIGAAAGLQLRALPEFPLAHRPGQAAALLLLAGGVAVLVALTSERSRRAAPVALFALCISLYLLAAVWVLPAADIYKSSRPFCEEVAREVGPDDPLRLYRPWRWRASYSYYLNRSIPALDSPDALGRYAAQPGRRYVIVEGELEPAAVELLGGAEPLVTRRAGSRTLRLFSTGVDESSGGHSGGS